MSVSGVSKAYLVVALVVAIVVAPLPYSPFAFALLVFDAYFFLKSRNVGWSLVFVLSSVFLVSLSFQSLLDSLFVGSSGFLVLPAIFALDKEFRDYTSRNFGRFEVGGRFTFIFKAFVSTLFSVFVLSVILWNPSLIVSALVVGGYVCFVLLFVLRSFPKRPIEVSRQLLRVLVGNEEELSVSVKGKVGLPCYVYLNSVFSWVSVDPKMFVFNLEKAVTVKLVVSPPLAGSFLLKIEAFLVDPWGFTVRNQILEPVELHVIPKARYAEWLAKKFLEMTSSGSSWARSMVSSRSAKSSRSGIEFYGNRRYVPGDALKNIDWRHTFKFQELVVKEFSGLSSQLKIIVVNLKARDIKDADQLAYNLVMSVLTLAVEGSSYGALIAYDEDELVSVVCLENPRELLKRALKLTGKISLGKGFERVLEPIDIRLRNSLLSSAYSREKVNRGFLEILELEKFVGEKMIKGHPVMEGLSIICKSGFVPGAFVVISSGNDQSELSVIMERYRRKGCNLLFLDKSV